MICVDVMSEVTTYQRGAARSKAVTGVLRPVLTGSPGPQPPAHVVSLHIMNAVRGSLKQVLLVGLIRGMYTYTEMFSETCEHILAQVRCGVSPPDTHFILSLLTGAFAEPSPRRYFLFLSPTSPAQKVVMPLRCAQCGGSPEGGFKICARCGTTHYCNKKCQKRNWRVHRGTCSHGERHFEVTARLLNGDHKALSRVTRLTTVADVKAMLIDWIHSDRKLDLIYRKQLLTDGQTLEEAGVSASDELLVIVHSPTPSLSGDEPPGLIGSDASD